jgi:hypothetical protein
MLRTQVTEMVFLQLGSAIQPRRFESAPEKFNGTREPFKQM